MAPPDYPSPKVELISPEGLARALALYREIRETGMTASEFLGILFRDYGVRFLNMVPADEEEPLIDQFNRMSLSRQRKPLRDFKSWAETRRSGQGSVVRDRRNNEDRRRVDIKRSGRDARS